VTHPERTDTRRADAAAKAAADLPDDEGNRALALLVACLLTPYGYGDPVSVAEWILGDKAPIDKHLDDLKGEFLADTEREEIRENGRRLASERDDLIAAGANPNDLLIPLAPIDDEEALGGTDADQAVGWYTAAMGWKTRAIGAEAEVKRLRAEMRGDR
jgi:hypothetical protein